jgi:hypothetical protein
MASSRWKRFAFFERHTLNLASEVLEDLIPIGGSTVGTNDISASTKNNTRSSVRRSTHSLNEAAEASSNDNVSLVVTTASLPLNSKPTAVPSANANVQGDQNHALALNDMWSSLTACNPMDLSGVATGDGNVGSTERTIKLPSQAQAMQDESNVTTSTNSVDGLVLVFVTSRDTDRIHCFDLTVRCTPTSSSSTGKDLEDMDGWRGYIAPLKGQTRATSKSTHRDQGSGARTAEDRIIAEHLGGKDSSNAENQKEGIVGIATTRASSGHRPVHMACISENNLVVCVDPHLYLSW